MVNTNYWSFLILLIFFVNIVQAQNNTINISDFDYPGFPSHQDVYCLLEDSEGFLWIGTRTGLFQYDGSKVKQYQYNVFDPTSIPNNTVKYIQEDTNKNLWIGTESYLVKYSRKKDHFDGYFKGNEFQHLESKNDGSILAIASKTSILKITTDSLTQQLRFDTLFQVNKSSEEGLVINQIKVDEFGRIWIASTQGLYYLIDSRLYSTGITFPVQRLHMSADQIAWLSSGSQVYMTQYTHTNNDIRILKKLNLSTPNYNGELIVSSILERKDKSLWVSSNKGLFRKKVANGDKNFEMLQSNLPNTSINDLAEDMNGNLWLATQKGLRKYVRNASVFNMVKLENYEESLHDASVVDLYSDTNNDLWLTTSNGKYAKFKAGEKGNIEIFESDDVIIDIKLSLQEDKLWLLSHRKLSHLQSGKGEKQILDKEFDFKITDLIEINSNEFWIGTWGQGIYILDEIKAISEFKKKVIERTKEAYVSFTYMDKAGLIWIGTRGKGLFKVDVELRTVDQYLPDLDLGITSNAFLSYCEDFSNDIWFGTRGGGLIQYDREKNLFIPFMSKDGLPSNTVTAIEEDHQHNIWLSTQNGIARLANGDKAIASFGSINGLKVSQFSYNSSTKSADSERIYFGFKGGFYEIICNNYIENKLTPKTKIRSLKGYGKESDKTTNQINLINSDEEIDKISLPYNKNNISIEFASSDLTAPEKNLYAYQLEGVNDYWIYSSDNSYKADYYDLNPGEYQFNLKSSNSDGLWNEKPTSVLIKITPPFWRSWWAYLIYALAFLGLLYGFYIASKRWYKLKQKLLKETLSREKEKQFHKMRMTFFTDIAHELRTPLTLILSSMEHFISKNKSEGNHKDTARIFNNTNKMKHLINQIMDIRKHSEGQFRLKVKRCDAVKVIKTIQTNFSDLAKINEVKLSFHSDKSEIIGFLDVSIIEKIVNNLLSNAIKHTPKDGQVAIRLAVTNSMLKCIIKDSGEGINESDLKHIFNRYYQVPDHPNSQIKGTGIGMELVSKLVNLHHGSIKAASEEHKFTEFIVQIPMDRASYGINEISEQLEISQADMNLLKSSSSLSLPASEKQIEAKKTAQIGQILIVDDNEELQGMMKDQLQNEHQLLSAADGLEAMEMSKEHLPDLIICDVNMPKEDGISFLKEIKNNTTLSHIPVIMFSAKIDEETKKDSIQYGAEDFIEKPFSLDFLKWKINNTLSYQKSMKARYSKKITAVPSDVDLESPDERLMKNVVSIIEQNIANTNLSVEFLSTEVGMSRANLYRKTQKLMNDTPVNLIKTMRLMRAKQIIDLDKFYISEVAEMTGFKSQRYFSACFQKEYKLTPMEYSKKQKREKESVIA